MRFIEGESNLKYASQIRCSLKNWINRAIQLYLQLLKTLANTYLLRKYIVVAAAVKCIDVKSNHILREFLSQIHTFVSCVAWRSFDVGWQMMRQIHCLQRDASLIHLINECRTQPMTTYVVTDWIWTKVSFQIQALCWFQIERLFWNRSL